MEARAAALVWSAVPGPRGTPSDTCTGRPRFDAEVFRAVLEGKVPDGSGRTLVRRDGDGKLVHRPGRNVTLSAPKSVSLIGLVGGDGRVVDVHVRAVADEKETIALMEAERERTRALSCGRGSSAPRLRPGGAALTVEIPGCDSATDTGLEVDNVAIDGRASGALPPAGESRSPPSGPGRPYAGCAGGSPRGLGGRRRRARFDD